MIRAHALQQYDLDVLAERHAWERMEIPPNTNFMISFKKMDIRLNFWLSTGTVASCLLHPKQGKTQLFRRKVTLEEAEQIFINPRIHTGKGYQKKPVIRVRPQIIKEELLPLEEVGGRKRNRDEDGMDIDEADEEETLRPLKKSRISCQFGASCQQEDCKFEHRCRYGLDCTRKNCIYDHSADSLSSWWYDQPCRYNRKCCRNDCQFMHPDGKSVAQCKYGMWCTRQGCWYYHDV